MSTKAEFYTLTLIASVTVTIGILVTTGVLTW